MAGSRIAKDEVSYPADDELELNSDAASFMKQALAVLQNPKADWKETFAALTHLRTVAVLSSSTFTQTKMVSTVVRLLCPQIASIRSTLAKNGMLCATSLFAHLPFAMDKHYSAIIPALLRRTVDNNEFIASAAKETMEAVVEIMGAQMGVKLLKFLLKDIKNKNYGSSVKANISEYVSLIIDTVKIEDIFKNASFLQDIVGYLAPALYERNEGTRLHARAAVTVLARGAKACDSINQLQDTVKRYTDVKYQGRFWATLKEEGVLDSEASSSTTTKKKVTSRKKAKATPKRSNKKTSSNEKAALDEYKKMQGKIHRDSIDSSHSSQSTFSTNSSIAPQTNDADLKSQKLDGDSATIAAKVCKEFVSDCKKCEPATVLAQLTAIRTIAVNDPAALKNTISGFVRKVKDLMDPKQCPSKLVVACLQTIGTLYSYASGLMAPMIAFLLVPLLQRGCDSKKQIRAGAEQALHAMATTNAHKSLCKELYANLSKAPFKKIIVGHLGPVIERVGSSFVEDKSLCKSTVIALAPLLYEACAETRNHARGAVGELVRIAKELNKEQNLTDVLEKSVNKKFHERFLNSLNDDSLSSKRARARSNSSRSYGVRSSSREKQKPSTKMSVPKKSFFEMSRDCARSTPNSPTIVARSSFGSPTKPADDEAVCYSGVGEMELVLGGDDASDYEDDETF